MIGIIFITALIVWALIALGLSRLLRVIFRFFVNTSRRENEEEPSSWETLRNVGLQLLMAVVIFFLPITDEIVAYPHYYQMCETAGKYEFPPEMDEDRAYGRQYYLELGESRFIRIFPKLESIVIDGNKKHGVVVEVREARLVDVSTKEIILISNGIKPISSMFAIPWDGSRHPWLLHKCDWNIGKNAEDSKKLIRSLKLKRIAS